jgi:hypothetical protein
MCPITATHEWKMSNPGDLDAGGLPLPESGGRRWCCSSSTSVEPRPPPGSCRPRWSSWTEPGGNVCFWGQGPIVPFLLLSPPFFPIIHFLSTTPSTGMTGMLFSKRKISFFFHYRSNTHQCTPNLRARLWLLVCTILNIFLQKIGDFWKGIILGERRKQICFINYKFHCCPCSAISSHIHNSNQS